MWLACCLAAMPALALGQTEYETFYPLRDQRPVLQHVARPAGQKSAGRYLFSDPERITTGQISGIQFYTLVYFSLEGLPRSPVRVRLWLYEEPIVPSLAHGQIQVLRVTSSWEVKKVSGVLMGQAKSSRRHAWKFIDLTETYLAWRSGLWTEQNYGLAICPTVKSADPDQMNSFASWEHPVESVRPFLAIQTTDTGWYHFPLRGGYLPEMITGYNFGEPWLPESQRTISPANFPLLHTGIDLRAEVGDPVCAIASGMVKLSTTDPKWGGYIVVEHHHGDLPYTATYTHVLPGGLWVSQLFWVQAGDVLGTIAPGNANFSPHLHFQIRLGEYDPARSLLGRLPEVSATTTASPNVPEPAFPENFYDPRVMPWE